MGIFQGDTLPNGWPPPLAAGRAGDWAAALPICAGFPAVDISLFDCMRQAGSGQK
jgi:hypothetical protein